jgi:putative transposase
MVSPQVKRQAVNLLREERGLGVTRACGLVGISRSLYACRRRRPDSAPLRQRICDLASQKRRVKARELTAKKNDA